MKIRKSEKLCGNVLYNYEFSSFQLTSLDITVCQCGVFP